MDGSPSKAWMVHHRGEPEVRALFEMGFGKFPAEELYDLDRDPAELTNVADRREYAAVRSMLSGRLRSWLRSAGDPLPATFADLPPAGTILATGARGP
jgi:hypothetical protein